MTFLEVTEAVYSPVQRWDAQVSAKDRGKWLTIYSKQADGSWRIVRDVFNFDLPLPALEKPAEPAKK